MTLETAARLNLRVRLIGTFAGFPIGIALGFTGAFLVGKALPAGPSAWSLLVLLPLFAGIPLAIVGIAYLTEFIASHITADCPKDGCPGRVHVLKQRVFRCDRCATKFTSDADAGSEFESIVRRNEAKVQDGLSRGERGGSVSLTEPGKAGALSKKESA